MAPQCSRDPVVFRGSFPFAQRLLRDVEHLTWQAAGHAPTSRILVRFDQEGSYVHAMAAGFEGSRADWTVEQQCGDPGAYTCDLFGLTRTPPACCRSHGRRILVDVFFSPDVAPDGFWLSTLAHELAHAADLSVLGDGAPRSLPSLPRRYGQRRKTGEERFAESISAEMVRRLGAAHPFTDPWEEG